MWAAGGPSLHQGVGDSVTSINPLQNEDGTALLQVEACPGRPASFY